MKQKSEFIIKIAFVYSSAARCLWNDDDRTCMFLFLLYTSATKKWKNSVKCTWTGDVLLCGKKSLVLEKILHERNNDRFGWINLIKKPKHVK